MAIKHYTTVLIRVTISFLLAQKQNFHPFAYSFSGYRPDSVLALVPRRLSLITGGTPVLSEPKFEPVLNESGDILSHPSLFKVLYLKGCDSRLKFPPLFAGEHFSHLKEKATPSTLKSLKGVWPVVLEFHSPSNCYISEDWERFASANNIQFGEFLVFFLTEPNQLTAILYHTPRRAPPTLPAVDHISIIRSPLPQSQVQPIPKLQSFNMRMPSGFMKKSGLID